MWAHILNILPSLIYLYANILAFYVYRTEKITTSSNVLLLQVIGDLVYLIDAYLYYECWQKDKEELNTTNENQSLNKFY